MGILPKIKLGTVLVAAAAAVVVGIADEVVPAAGTSGKVVDVVLEEGRGRPWPTAKLAKVHDTPHSKSALTDMLYYLLRKAG